MVGDGGGFFGSEEREVQQRTMGVLSLRRFETT